MRETALDPSDFSAEHFSPRVSQAVEFRLSADERAVFELVEATIRGEGLKTTARVAGGWVRNMLLNRPGGDIDLAFDTVTGVSFARAMQRHCRREKSKAMGGFGVVHANPEQSKHLETATAVVCGRSVDLANLRSDTYAASSRIPTVRLGTPLEDAERRDFTVNSLFYNLSTGEVEDFLGRGISDLRRRLLRTPVDARTTFLEDPLRVLRGIRFASRFRLDVDPGVVTAASDPAVVEALRYKVSRERIGIELRKITHAPTFPRALDMVFEWGLADVVFPVRSKQRRGRHDDVDEVLWADHPEAVLLARRRLHFVSGIIYDRSRPENARLFEIRGQLVAAVLCASLCDTVPGVTPQMETSRRRAKEAAEAAVARAAEMGAPPPSGPGFGPGGRPRNGSALLQSMLKDGMRLSNKNAQAVLQLVTGSDKLLEVVGLAAGDPEQLRFCAQTRRILLAGVALEREAGSLFAYGGGGGGGGEGGEGCALEEYLARRCGDNFTALVEWFQHVSEPLWEACVWLTALRVMMAAPEPGAPEPSQAYVSTVLSTTAGLHAAMAAALGDSNASNVYRVTPMVDGHDVMRLTSAEGPHRRDCLHASFAWQLNHPHATREDVLEFVVDFAKSLERQQTE